jgi:hypothetical protein
LVKDRPRRLLIGPGFSTVAREVMPTWERMWDDFVQEEIRLASEASGQRQQQQQQMVRVRRILLFGQRARRRPAEVVGKVPRL